MADPNDYWSLRRALVLLVTVVVLDVCVILLIKWWRWIRLFTLGGVTTLTQRLNYTCTMCQHSMEAGEKVRTLSCDHAFHCGGNARCERNIDKYLLIAEVMMCPLCLKRPYPVLWSKQPPPSSPAPSSSASSEPALQQLPRTSSTQDLEQALLPPANDQTLAETSSSPAAPPLAQTQLPRTSTPELAVVLPLPADDEMLPEASSSQ